MEHLKVVTFVSLDTTFGQQRFCIWTESAAPVGIRKQRQRPTSSSSLS